MADNTTPFVLANFGAGLNSLTDPTKLQDGEYPLLINGRTRFNNVRPVKKSLKITGIPSGKVQGLYAAVDWILVFVDGHAFYRNYAQTNAPFFEVKGFDLDSAVDVIYAEAVPQARVGGVRKAADASSTGDVSITGLIGGNASPACIVCQDGINQPIGIMSDGSCRTLQTIDQWTNPNEREYVPIGKQMMYYNGVLYIVSSDGRMIFRSVSGRPLDFVIAIDVNGNKLVDGGSTADKTAHTVDYAAITAIRSLGAFDGAFFVSTTRQSYQVSPITDGSVSMVYGEPVFRNIPLFPTGALNQFSVVDLLGDTAIIDYAGIRSYNAVMQLRNAGKNSPFSAKIQSLFTKSDGTILTQSLTCAVEFDNYAFFALLTIYGNVVLVYDCVNQCWAGMDIYEGIDQIKFMAVVQTALTRKLLFATTDDEIYEAFGSTTDSELCQVYIGEFTSSDPRSELKPERLRLVFSDVYESGSVYAQIYSDRVAGIQHAELLKANNPPPVYPLALPFGTINDDSEKNVSFDLGRESTAWKHGFFVSWNFNAILSRVAFEAAPQQQDSNLEQTAGDEIAVKAGLPYIYTVNAQAAIPTQVIRLTGKGFLNVTLVMLDNIVLPGFNLNDDQHLAFTIPAGFPVGLYRIRLQTTTTEVEWPINLEITTP